MSAFADAECATRPMSAEWRDALMQLDRAFAEAERLGIETAEAFDELVELEAEAADERGRLVLDLAQALGAP